MSIEYAVKEVLSWDGTDQAVVRHFNGKAKKLKELKHNNITFYGTEIELEKKRTRLAIDKIVEKLTSKINTKYIRYYAKRDGSLVNGVEFVSNPCSISAWTSQWRMVRKLFKLANIYFKANERCGHHIHISKNSFANYDHFYRFWCFFVDNRDRFRIKLSDRTDLSRYEQYASIDEMRYTDYEDLAYQWRIGGSTNKYAGVRLTRNTAEVRIFQGTMDWETFIGRLQLIDIIKTWTIRDRGSNFNDMYKWAKERQTKWLKNTWKWGIKLLEEKLREEIEVLQECA